MSQRRIEDLMDLFELRADALAVLEISPDSSVEIAAVPAEQVYFVLRGSGVLETKFGPRELREGTVLIMPRNLAQVVRGAADGSSSEPVRHLATSEDRAVSRFSFGGDEPGLVIGCATVHATLGGVMEVFQHLWEPMIEVAEPDGRSPLLLLIEEELASARLGSRAVIASLLKHLLITVFRGQLARESFRNWLWPAMMNPQLGRAALAIMAQPQASHTVESLAAAAGLSRSRFTELFTEAFERTPMEFLQVVRLRAAKRLLVSSSLPIKSVAAAVGYASRSHFSRAFQAEFGDAPSAYRGQATSVA